MISYRGLRPDEASAFAGFTFPAFRHLLGGEPAAKYLTERSEPVRPLAVAALDSTRPAGLALVAVPFEPAEDPELLSLFVGSSWRGEGIGTHLVGLVEETLAELGHERVRTVYMTGRPGIIALERVLAKRGWERPGFRMASVRLSWERFRQAPWLDRYRGIPGYDTVPWASVSDADKAEARHRHEVDPWINQRLAFWVYDAQGFEPVTSLGIRYHGELVGWVINHRHDDDTLRLTCAFIRDDLARVGLALPAVSESFHLMPRAGFSKAMFTTPRDLPRMLEFLGRWIAPWADFVGETRGSSRTLRAGGGV
jgi:GNAT superfamily N-acetyltransferase